MRMILTVTMPHEPFNALVRKGDAGPTIRRILEATRPEAAYFTETHGHRTAVLVVQVNDASQIPSLAEPWFLNFQGDCEFRIAMSAEDLARAGLDELGKTWG